MPIKIKIRSQQNNSDNENDRMFEINLPVLFIKPLYSIIGRLSHDKKYSRSIIHVSQKKRPSSNFDKHNRRQTSVQRTKKRLGIKKTLAIEVTENHGSRRRAQKPGRTLVSRKLQLHAVVPSTTVSINHDDTGNGESKNSARRIEPLTSLFTIRRGANERTTIAHHPQEPVVHLRFRDIFPRLTARFAYRKSVQKKLVPRLECQPEVESFHFEHSSTRRSIRLDRNRCIGRFIVGG